MEYLTEQDLKIVSSSFRRLGNSIGNGSSDANFSIVICFYLFNNPTKIDKVKT